MSVHLPLYEHLYAVSDIHMGGRRDSEKNFQIFDRGQRLGNLIDHISNQHKDEEVCLVLNGDIIDSLAEDEVNGYVALDGETAVRMMDHIFTDASFVAVWDPLARFVGRPKKHLVLVVGNHDIELGLPVVAYAIKRRLASDEDAAARIHFATDGGGIACRVGGARVFCTHGNELDEWNWVDFTKLGELANATNAGRAVDPSKWKANAGTRLVVDVMNKVKRRYPIVDILKPEAAAVASVLVALDKEAFKYVDLDDVIPMLRAKVKGGLVTRNLLSAEALDFAGVSPTDLAEESARHLLGSNFQTALEERRREYRRDERRFLEDDLLLDAEKAFQGEPSAVSTALAESEEGTLGVWDIVKGWVGLVSKPEGLRRALQDWLKDDQTFDVGHAGKLYEAMQDRIGSQVDFTITGHTHKPRALVMERGDGYYYNCGTWIRTLRLTEEALAEPKDFEKKVWPLLTARNMATLDKAQIPGPGRKRVPLLFDRTNVVQISVDGNRTVGKLLRVTDGDTEEKIRLETEPGTTPFEVG
ncbi:MAG: metallophosphoesterase [Phycisphaerales bacterium]|nr:MAG: metallophosphoesterase [Phycisphaerales bacterium]